MQKNNKNENIKIGYVTKHDPLNKKAWSGIHFQMYSALSDRFKYVIPIGSINIPIHIKLITLIIALLHRLFNKGYKRFHTILLSKYFAKKINFQLENNPVDIIIAPSASIEIAFLNTNTPIIYLSGTSFKQMNNYYNDYSNLSQYAYKQGEVIENNAISKSICQVYPSKWAADYVIEHYDTSKEKVFVFKYGANLSHTPSRNDVLNKDYNGCITFLFLGVDWERKGGDLVFNTVKTLLEKGYDVELIICGCNPRINHPKVTIVPSLDKNKDADFKVFNDLLLKSHFLFLPTRAELFGVAFAEANAFALPSITNETGGVPSVIKHNYNGLTFPVNATESEYANEIEKLLKAPDKIKSMAFNARKMYDEKTNWEYWGEQMHNLITSCIK